jgi:hypothetical protein
MRQIGLRHEAGLVGGICSCGRELCCSTWLTDFKTVSTSAARYQNLSLNPMKISGLCGRLKCCLNFELEVYMDALRDFPKTEMIDTQRGKAFLQKTDIFKGKMWFSYPAETTWYPLDIAEVKKIVEMNKAGEKPDALSTISPPEEIAEIDREMDFVDVVGTDKPLPEPRTRRKKNNNRKGRGDRGGEAGGQRSQNRRSPQNQEKSPDREGKEPKTPREGSAQNNPESPRKRKGPRNSNRGGRRGRGSQNNNRNTGSTPKTD